MHLRRVYSDSCDPAPEMRPGNPTYKKSIRIVRLVWHRDGPHVKIDMRTTLVIAIQGRNRIALPKWLAGSRVVGLFAAGTIAFGWCSSCQYAAHWPEHLTRGLAWAGVAVSTLGIVCGCGRLRSSHWPDGLLCLTLLAGFWLLAAAGSAGVQMCAFCALFWLAQLPLWFELACSDRPLRMAARVIPILGASIVLLAAASPDARWHLPRMVPPAEPAQLGPKLGTKFPPDILPASNGIVVVVTECAPCAQLGLQRRVEALSKNHSVTVLTGAHNSFAADLFPSRTLVRVPESFFAAMNVRGDGPPLIFEVWDGRIQRVGQPATFSVGKENK